MLEGSVKLGVGLDIALTTKRFMEEAGFVDVQEKVFKLPKNEWPQDNHLKTLGRMWEENVLSGLSGFSMAHYSRDLSWSKDQIEVSLAGRLVRC